jgi:membrane associated rhomboid family serine protease
METTVRTTRRLSEANEWSLVLTAAALPYRLQVEAEEWTLLVDGDDASAASAALDAYDAERQPAPVSAPPDAPGADFAWTTGLLAGLALLGFFAVTGPGTAHSEVFERGAGAARPMLHGQPWRAVTALTLHVDAMHVLGNTVATVLLVAAVVQALGPGVALGLVVLAGAVANLLAAAVYGAGHVAVGASTATFGALGILAALRFRAAPTTHPTAARRWTIPVATVLLLTLLGTSGNADVLAHVLGLVSGGTLGFLAGRRRAPLGATAQLVGALGTVLLVAAAWAAAAWSPAGTGS